MTQGIVTNLLKSVNGSDISNLAADQADGSPLQAGSFSEHLTKAVDEVLPANGNTDPLFGLPTTLLENDIFETEGFSLLPAEDLRETLLPISQQSLSEDATETLPIPLFSEKGLSHDAELINLPSTHKQLLDFQNKEITESATVLLSRNKITPTFENQTAQLLPKQDLEYSNNALLDKLPISSKDILLKDASFELTDLKSHRIDLHKNPDVTSILDKSSGTQQSINSIHFQNNPVNDISTLITRRIDVPVQQAGWGEAVGNRLMMMVNDKVQSALIHLNPPELGPIEVRVNVNHDQANVHFISNHSLVKDAIEEALPRLKEMFMQNGLTLADANVSQQSAHQGKGYTENSMEALSDNTNHSQDQDGEIQVDVIQSEASIGLVDHYV